MASDVINALPTLGEQRARRVAVPKFDGPSKAEANGKAEQDDKKALDKFRAKVFARDKGLCRCCKRKVVKTLKPVPERAEANHIASRKDKVVRHDSRNGVLLCKFPCHEKVTRHELFIVQKASLMFIAENGRHYINGDKDVDFVRSIK